MKRILLALLFCSASLLQGAGTRNLIMPMDWGKETPENEFKGQYQGLPHEQFGVVTQGLMAALIEQAAPIIVSSQTWRNLVIRGRIFADVVTGKDISYVQQFPMFSNSQNLNAFVTQLRAGYNAQADVMARSAGIPQLMYYMAYQLFFSKDPYFKPHQWIVKKVSDYLYLLIPVKYKEAIRARNDMTEEAPQIVTSLTADELLVGMKYEKFATIPVDTLLNWQAHATTFNVKNYKQLVPKQAYPLVERLVQYNWYEILNGYLFGQQVVNVLPQILITHSDLKLPQMKSDVIDQVETKYLHEWLVYLAGHGSPSQNAQLMPVVYDTQHGRGGVSTQASIAYTAGLEQGAFRDLLRFFNNSVNTGSLFYTSCYSGGPHLFKLFEHHWDYPKTQGQRIKKGQQAPKEFKAAQDVFNYLIIASNLFYTVTYTSTFSYYTDNNCYWPRLPISYSHEQRFGRQSQPQGLEFGNYFRSMASFLHPKPSSKTINVGAKKQKVVVSPAPEQELLTAIRYIHQFDFSRNYMIPAVRFPYTEWFVPLNDLGMELRLETEQVRKAREEEEKKTKVALQALFNKKELPKKVKESIKAQELQSPDVQEQARKAKELQEAQEKERKEKELFDRMEKMRKEQEERAKAAQIAAQQAAQKPKPTVPTQQPVKPTQPQQPVKPQTTQPAVAEPAKPQVVKPDKPQATKPAQPQKPQVGQPQKPTGQAGKPQIPAQAAKPNQPQQPVLPQVKPQQPLQPLPTQTNLPPVQPTGFKPIDISKLPPPPVLPIQVQQAGQSRLAQALKSLERSLYYLVDGLLLDENGQ